MKSHPAKLPRKEQQQLLNDLNYLNMAEIKSFCKRYAIPFRIAVETENGSRILTKEDDRKGIILDRIRHFLRTGSVPEATCFPAAVVCFGPLPENLREGDRLFYGQYDKTNQSMRDLLQGLTDGKFRHGAIARILAREFWSGGEAPTFAKYAAAWLEASRQHTKPNPEWAFLSDRASAGNIKNWKKLRAEKAAHVLATMHRLLSSG
ncbi:MAG: hypothetical protein WA510_14110 [Acidobacteriaceae bacterium]